MTIVLTPSAGASTVTLGAMKDRIATELHRSDLTDAIAYAMADAVALYQSKKFRFNQARDTFATVSGTEFYTESTIPDDMASIDTVSLTANGTTELLRVWSHARMEETRTVSSNTGQPTAWAWWSNQIRLYPIPDAAYTVTINYVQQLDLPTNDNDSNAWTNEASALIRHAAKRIVNADVMHDLEAASACAASEQSELRRLLSDAQELSSAGRAVMSTELGNMRATTSILNG